MKDQAEKLRQLMKGKVGRETNSFFKKKAKVVAVTSGKGELEKLILQLI